MNYYDFTKICALITAIIHQVGHVPGNEPLTAFVNSVYHISLCPIVGNNYKYYHVNFPEKGSAIMEDCDGVIFSKQIRGKLKAVYIYKSNLKIK